MKFKNKLGKWKQAEVEATTQAEAKSIVTEHHGATQIKSVVLIHRMAHITNENN